MDIVLQLFDFIRHIDKHLAEIMQNYGTFTYIILFVIVFCETGLVVTPFLPGDSLLFAAGALAPIGGLNIVALAVLLFIAAVIGDSVNYAVGKYIGPKVFEKKDSKIFRKEYLQKTQAFYDKYGAKTIVIARFVPIVRTFAPFLAGVGTMNYSKFIAYNVGGALLWVGLFLFAGYFFGNIPVIKNNFSLVILAIIILSILPAVFEIVKARRATA
jgi:membrane-associated protein